MRVVVLMVLATLVWVPIGVWLGLRPLWARRAQPVAQFLAAFPANLLFPPFVLFIVHFHLKPDIWLTPLMVLGTQWYILFNVVAGAAAFPGDLHEAASNFRVGGWLWWRKVIIPGIFPYYVTGAITASGGSWNAAIVAEVASWGDTKLTAHGLGAYIAEATERGDMARVVLGVVVMSMLRAAVQPPAVAAALCLLRTTPEARLNEEARMDTNIGQQRLLEVQRLQAGLPQGRQCRSGGAGRRQSHPARRRDRRHCSAARAPASRPCCASSPAC